MPDIGTLNLTIESNAQQAADGLDQLARKLKSVKNNAEGYDLSNVQTQISNIVNAVKGSEKAVSALGTLFNSISTYYKTFSKMTANVTINTKPIEDLRIALDNGIKIGQAGTQLSKLREALEGNWNTSNASDAGFALASIAEGAKSFKGLSLATLATGITKIADGLDKYASSVSHAKEALGISKSAIAEAKAVSDDLTKNGYVQTADGEWTYQPGGSYKPFMKLNTQFFGRKGAGDVGGNWRDMMSGIVESAKEVEKVSSSFDNLREVTDILKDFQITKTKGINIESLATALEHLQRAASDGLRLSTVLSNIQKLNEKAGEIQSSGIIGILHELAEALARVKESADGLQIQNIKINFTSGGRGSRSGGAASDATGFESTVQQVANEAESAFQTVQSTISGINMELSTFVNALQQVNDIGQSSTDWAEKMSRAFSAMFEYASKMRSAFALPWGGNNGLPENGFVFGEGTVSGDDVARIANETRDIIVYTEEMTPAWNKVLERMRTCREELEAYLEGQKQVIFGNESIKDLYENVNIGPKLAGKYGKDVQTDMISQLSDITGLSVENIVQQLYELSKGAVDLREAFGPSTVENVEEFKRSIEQIVNSTEPAVSKIELLRTKIAGLEKKIEMRRLNLALQGLDPNNDKDSIINGYKLQIYGINEQIEKLVNKAHEAQDALKFDAMKANADNLQRAYGSELVENLSNYSEIDLMTMKLDGMKQALADDINQNKVDTQQIADRMTAINNLTDKIEELKQAQESASNTTGLMGKAFDSLKTGIKAMFPTITSLLKRFKSMMIMRTMRYLIRQLAAGLSEGIKNVYYYSQAIGGDFAPAMDSAASALAQMKNSIGAALAPALQALLPYLQMAINAFINLINYVNQFFALMRGQKTWTHAVAQTTTAYDDLKKKANGASKAAKDLLADWDELNIIQSQGGGSGGGGSGKDTPDYSNMFEEVSEYSDAVKRIVEGIKEKFGDVWGLVRKIAVAILGWKFSNAFTGIVGTLGGLIGAATTLDIVFRLVSMFSDNYLSTGESGWLIGNILTTMLGAGITKKILSKVLKGKFAAYAIPITLTVSAVADAVALIKNTDVKALSKESLVTSVLSAAKVGLASGYLLYKVGGFTAAADLIGVGGAASLITFGVLVGLKAVKDTIDTKEITSDTIKADLLSGAFVGGGLALLGATMGLGTIGTLVLAGGGAILTVGALLGIQYLISSRSSTVKWGNFRATKEQIKAFVEDEKNGVFTVNPNTTLSIINPLIEVRSTAEEGLQTTVDEVKVLAKKISLGISDKDVLNDLEKKIFGDEATGSTGLIGQFKETAKAHQNIIETSITLVPVSTDDTGAAKELIDRQSEAWQKLTGGMDDLGKELSDHLAKAYSDDIDEKTKQMELKTINDLTNMLTNVSTAMMKGEQYEQAYQSLQDNLSNLTQGSWDDLFAYVEEYKEQIKSSFTTAYDEGTRSMASLAAGLKADMENELAMANDPNISKTEEEKRRHLANAAAYESEYKYWEDQVKERRKARKKAIEDATNAAENEEVMQLIRDSILPLIDTSAVIPQAVGDIFNGQRLRKTIWQQLFSDTGADKGEASETVETWLMQLIDNSFGTNASTIEKAVRLGFLNYGDVINKEAIDALASEIGIDKQPAAVQKAWNDLINDLVYGGKGNYSFTAPVLDTSGFTKSTEEMTNSAKEATDEIKELFANVQDAIFGSNSTKKNEYSEKIADMYANGKLAELKQLLSDIERYGIDEAFRRMGVGNNTGANLLQTTQQLLGKGQSAGIQYGRQGSAALASGGVNMLYRGDTSGIEWNPSRATGMQETQAVDYTQLEHTIDNGIDYSQMEVSVKNGTTKANEDVVSELRSAVQVLQRILAKPWVVNVQPTSALGRTVGQAGAAFGRATGDN